MGLSALGAGLRLAVALAVLFGSAACGSLAPTFPELTAWDDRPAGSLAIEPDERKLWEEAREAVGELEQAELLAADEGVETYLAGIVSKLSPPSAAAGPKLRVEVLLRDERNAAALPDGTILFDLPLLASFENEAQLAFILGHEIVHILHRDSLRSSRYGEATPSHVHRMKLSRELEAEADRKALGLMAAAGYSPGEAESALAKAGSEERSSHHPWDSHFDLGHRRGVLRRLLKEQPGADGALRAEPFEAALDAVRLRAVEIELEAGRFDRALALVGKQIARHPGDGPAFALRARITGAKDPAELHSDAVRADLERAVLLGPNDADSLRALGLWLRDAGDRASSGRVLRRYLEVLPDAYDRKLIERYLVAEDPAGDPADR